MPDGEAPFTYASDDEAKRFECPASQTEIGCLTDALGNATDDEIKKKLTKRKDVSLPNYMKQFGCGK